MIVLRLLGYLWALPHTVLGLLLLLPYGPTWMRWHDGALEVGVRRVIGFSTTSGQAHGWVIYYKGFSDPVTVRPSLRVHERCHVTQAFVGGPLYMLAYKLSFLVLLLWHQDAKKAYKAIPFEVAARKKAASV